MTDTTTEHRGVTPCLSGRQSMSLAEARYILAHPQRELIHPPLIEEAREVVKRGVHRREI